MTEHRTTDQLREDALAIWQAGVDAVASDRLVQENIRVHGDKLMIADEVISLNKVRHICVVGAGKAGAGMAAGLEAALGPQVLDQKKVTGWVNVPADCVRPLRNIHLHAARPAGVNEPTPEGIVGTEKILQIVSDLDQRDLCICLLSGGGSALLPAPAPGITLAQKLAVTQHLSGAGANIEQLNTVRKQLSRLKGGGLARASNAGRMITLIISDVLGDPLDVIASGPTVANTTSAQDAISVLQQFPLPDPQLAEQMQSYLQNRSADQRDRPTPKISQVEHFIIGNNSVAVDAAGQEAERRGYSHTMLASPTLEGEANAVGRSLGEMAQIMRSTRGSDCLITGGEPIVTLTDSTTRGLGGRNQQLVLAALHELTSGSNQPPDSAPLAGTIVLAGGTDGEDGPTDAAGAFADTRVAQAACDLQLDLADYLRRNDAYHFFEKTNSLIKTGPTHTNVCDLRVVVVARVASPQ